MHCINCVRWPFDITPKRHHGTPPLLCDRNGYDACEMATLTTNDTCLRARIAVSLPCTLSAATIGAPLRRHLRTLRVNHYAHPTHASGTPMLRIVACLTFIKLPRSSALHVTAGTPLSPPLQHCVASLAPYRLTRRCLLLRSPLTTYRGISGYRWDSCQQGNRLFLLLCSRACQALCLHRTHTLAMPVCAHHLSAGSFINVTDMAHLLRAAARLYRRIAHHLYAPFAADGPFSLRTRTDLKRAPRRRDQA